jgi:hypothetical protein
MTSSRAQWTYELPSATGDSVWLEDYLVYDKDGEPAGTVFAVLEHEGQRWLGIERDHLPGWSDRRAVPFEAIGETDHDNHSVHLALPAEAIEHGLQLDPKAGIERGGTARRVTDVPAEQLPPRRAPSARAAVDSTPIVASQLPALVGVLALLAVFVFWARATRRTRCRTSPSRACSSRSRPSSATARSGRIAD